MTELDTRKVRIRLGPLATQLALDTAGSVSAEALEQGIAALQEERQQSPAPVKTPMEEQILRLLSTISEGMLGLQHMLLASAAESDDEIHRAVRRLSALMLDRFEHSLEATPLQQDPSVDRMMRAIKARMDEQARDREGHRWIRIRILRRKAQLCQNIVRRSGAKRRPCQIFAAERPSPSWATQPPENPPRPPGGAEIALCGDLVSVDTA